MGVGACAWEGEMLLAAYLLSEWHCLIKQHKVCFYPRVSSTWQLNSVASAAAGTLYRGSSAPWYLYGSYPCAVCSWKLLLTSVPSLHMLDSCLSHAAAATPRHRYTGMSIIELGSGPGLAGLLAAKLGAQVVITLEDVVLPPIDLSLCMSAARCCSHPAPPLYRHEYHRAWLRSWAGRAAGRQAGCQGCDN
jgi:hypothetical protein